jgi:hypothetical protein
VAALDPLEESLRKLTRDLPPALQPALTFRAGEDAE